MTVGVAIVLALVALVVGAVVGFLVAAQRSSAKLQSFAADKARAEQNGTRAAGLESKVEDFIGENTELQKKIVALTKQQEADAEKIAWASKAEEHLREAFEALASQALKSNTEQFATRAKEQVMEPLAKSLHALDDQVRQMEEKRAGAYKSLDQQLLNLKDAYDQLRDTTTGLTSALTTSSGTRGAWGEIQLRRIVEMSGMVSHVDFEEQERGDAGQPDMVVRLPNGGVLPVDAKTPMKIYLEAMEASTDSARKSKLQAHASAVKGRVRDLSGKEYWRQFEQAPDIVVMFIPNEAALAGAFEGDRDLLDYALDQRVLISSPVTLFALLKTVAFAWQQRQMTENAREIAQEARDLSKRLGVFLRHIEGTGKSLDAAVKAHNQAVGSLNSRVLPSVRRFKELGVSEADASELKKIEGQTAPPPAADQ